MELITDIGEYLQAFREQWQWILGTSIAMLAIGMAWNAGFKRWRLTPRIQVVAVLAIASFLTWRAEHRLAQDRPHFAAKEFHLVEKVVVRRNGTLAATASFFQLKLVNVSERRFAKAVSGELIVLSEELDPTRDPVDRRPIEAVNEIGPNGGELNVGVESEKLPKSGQLYIYITIQYEDSATGKGFDQVFYNKWTGMQGGSDVFLSTLFQVNSEEQRRIDECLSKIVKRPADKERE